MSSRFSLCQNSLFRAGYCRLVSIDHILSAYPLVGTWVASTFSASVNNAAMNEYKLTSRIDGPYGNSNFNFLRPHHSVFYHGCTILHSHWHFSFTTSSPTVVIFHSSFLFFLPPSVPFLLSSFLSTIAVPVVVDLLSLVVVLFHSVCESLSSIRLFATSRTVTCQAPLHGILQARILEWVASPFSRESSPPRDQTQISCIAGKFFTVWDTREVPIYGEMHPF